MFTDYNYIKNHYRLIAVDLSRQKELDADQKQFNKQNWLENLKNYITQTLMLNLCLFQQL